MAAGPSDETAEARAEAARRKITDCDRRLAKYRATLDSMEAGDPAAIGGWIAEVQGERLAAEVELGACTPSSPPKLETLREALASLDPMVLVLADAADKAVRRAGDLRHLRRNSTPCAS